MIPLWVAIVMLAAVIIGAFNVWLVVRSAERRMAELTRDEPILPFTLVEADEALLFADTVPDEVREAVALLAREGRPHGVTVHMRRRYEKRG